MGSGQMKVAIIQPLAPHYREAFFEELSKRFAVDVYIYENDRIVSEAKFRESACRVIRLACWRRKAFRLFNPLPFLGRKYAVVVLTGSPFLPSNWLIMAACRLTGRKTILWGQGISVRKYVAEAKKMPRLMRWFYRLASGAWFYTETEAELWKRLLPSLVCCGLGNTISGVEQILTFRAGADQLEAWKKKYRIATPRNLIFCARFSNPHRRSELLPVIMDRLDPREYGLIVIGDGPEKPDLSGKANVYDFGGLYDDAVKRELFSIAGIYLQPGWLGLSVVEAMAYGLPVLTLKRSAAVPQGVEYAYVEESGCGIAAETPEEMVQAILHTDPARWREMGEAARAYVETHLTMSHMVSAAAQLVEELTAGSGKTI